MSIVKGSRKMEKRDSDEGTPDRRDLPGGPPSLLIISLQGEGNRCNRKVVQKCRRPATVSSWKTPNGVGQCHTLWRIFCGGTLFFAGGGRKLAFFAADLCIFGDLKIAATFCRKSPHRVALPLVPALAPPDAVACPSQSSVRTLPWLTRTRRVGRAPRPVRVTPVTCRLPFGS